MNIILSGYGRMGKEIESIAVQRGHTILSKIDSSKDWENLKVVEKHPVVIDFSMPEVAIQNILNCFNRNLPMVCGTTGWDSKKERIKELCNKKEQTLFAASNFSIGMNLFFSVNKRLARLMDNFENYGVNLEETHHIHKLDKPSGTAIKIAEDILEAINRKKEWTLEPAKSESNLSIKAIRRGEVPGEHIVRYISEADKIEIKHEAINRKGFAIGAVMAAEWVVDKKGYFEMDDMLGIK
ncbi:MAG: 4-hydroxy-tetrahydrodipicolinate reductase [Bacteroidales bacterium]|nr:4-hydroxy-tetrahydrodipicolinate reductase [Bacteroidales bacterium]